MSPIDPDAAVIMALSAERLADAETIIAQARQIEALRAALRVQGRAICLLTRLLVSEDTQPLAPQAPSPRDTLPARRRSGA